MAFATGTSGDDSLEQRSLCAAAWHVSDCLLLTFSQQAAVEAVHNLVTVNWFITQRSTHRLLQILLNSTPSAALTEHHKYDSL